MSEWQPIETAPKDGTRILAWAFRQGWERHGSTQVVCAWHGGRWAVMGACGGGHWADTKDECTPLHWQPLPTPPKDTPHADR